MFLKKLDQYKNTQVIIKKTFEHWCSSSASLLQKLALYSKMQDGQDGSGGGGGRLGPPAHPPIKEEEDKELPPGAEYLSSRCVLFTYFQGDISTVVDEHFSRALSHTAAAAAYPPSGSHKAVRGVCVCA